MRWVNETLPPRPRRRWLLMTTRLSMSSFAGIARTLVAVGTARLASMLVTIRAAAPRRGEVTDDPLCGSDTLSRSLRSLAPSALTPLPRAAGSLAAGGAFGAVAGLRSGCGNASAGAGRAGAASVSVAPVGLATVGW